MSTAVTVETAYFDYIVRRDVQVLYRGKQITAIEPCVNGKLWRIYYSETETTVLAASTMCTIEVIPRGNHAR